MGASDSKKSKSKNKKRKKSKKHAKQYSDKDIVFFVVNNENKNIPNDIILIIVTYYLNIPPPIESLQKLNPIQLELFEKIKSQYGNRLDAIYPFVIRRFIIGCSRVYTLLETRERETLKRIDYYLTKHDEYNFPTILDNPLPNEDIMFKAWPIYAYGYDKQGHPIIYDEIASSVITEIENAFHGNLDLIRKYRFRFHRRLANCKRIQSERYGTMIYKHIMVFDLSGFTSAHVNSNNNNVEILKEIITEEQSLFPETLYKLYIINTPFVFRLLWKIVRTFVDPQTQKKINVLGKSYIDEMIKEIDIDQIPEKYKGKGTKPINVKHDIFN